ncbi:hypothetical protein [Rhodococcus kronopolitis]|uniref:Uncharacterized protein n=1 Tax=Rhodococcus kronopolitis TaxID=1460226 RepID=A0ABV9FXM1_9NOCA
MKKTIVAALAAATLLLAGCGSDSGETTPETTTASASVTTPNENTSDTDSATTPADAPADAPAESPAQAPAPAPAPAGGEDAPAGDGGATSPAGADLYASTCADMSEYLEIKGVTSPQERADTIKSLMESVEPSAEWAEYSEAQRDQIRKAAAAAQEGKC